MHPILQQEIVLTFLTIREFKFAKKMQEIAGNSVLRIQLRRASIQKILTVLVTMSLSEAN